VTLGDEKTGDGWGFWSIIFLTLAIQVTADYHVHITGKQAEV
jgi:hypothetical protein